MVLAACSPATRYDLALNFGVCGSFDRRCEPGDVVHVVTDRIAELGAEDGEAFLTVQELNLLGEHEPSPTAAGEPGAAGERGAGPASRGQRHHREHRPRQRAIDRRGDRALQAAGGKHGGRRVHVRLPDSRVAFAQVRAVSNVVERRNRGAWKWPTRSAAWEQPR